MGLIAVVANDIKNQNFQFPIFTTTFSELPVVTGPGTLPHYQLGDLGLIPRPKQTIPTSLDKMRVLSATTRLGGLRKVLCRSVGIQTVSAPKVNNNLLSCIKYRLIKNKNQIK